MAFTRLQELAAAENSNNLTDTMSVYIQRKINDDLQFAAGLIVPNRSGYDDGDKEDDSRNGNDDGGLYLLWFYVHGDDDVET
ncbi:hypothetical protein Tco_0015552 [Tanacetum coccineum]